MDDTYKELTGFKYEANLLYAASILKNKKINFEIEDKTSFKLFVKPEDHTKALSIINGLELDESEVNEDSDGYLEGYKEWTDKQYVNGYFTGGVIPTWMYGKKYAKYFGPIFFISGLFAIFMIGLSGSFLASIPALFIFSIYTVCGALMTMKGFKK